MIEVKVKKLSPDAVIPKRAKEGDMCMDLTAISVEYDPKKDAYIYHTGLAFETPMNIGSLLFVRSSNCKTDAYLANHVGVADIASYRGEIMLVFKNRTSYKVRCLVDEWEYLNKATESVSLNNDDNVRETLDKIKETIREPFKIPDPMDFAPYNAGDRVGQIMFVELPEVKMEEVEELNPSDRGEGGFGSTGK
jgi:dUTP pyrophosphatase